MAASAELRPARDAAAAEPIGPPRGALPPRAGVGLKPEHFRAVLDARPDIGFFEVHAENYMVAGGPYHHFLARIRERYPLSLHGVGLSIGADGPLCSAHLDRLAALVERYEPAVFSEHLAWSSHGGRHFADLLPLPYERCTLQRVCDHVDQVQTRLKRTLLLENPSTYVEFAASTMSEAAFLREVVARTGCALLLDVNNLHVSCTNHGRDARAELDALPLAAVRQIHLAGFARAIDAAGAPLLIDHHGAPVDAAVWDLFAAVVDRTGPRPALLERDHDVPALEVLVAEARQAEVLMGRERAGAAR